MKKILLISSLYPVKSKPEYGIFVKNCEEELIKNQFVIEKVVISDISSNILKKLLIYFCFYFNIIYKGIFKQYDIIYAHFVSHIAIPVLVVLFIKKLLKFKFITITNIHGSDILVDSKLRKLIYKFFIYPFVYLLFLKSDLIISPSKAYKKVINQKFKIDLNKIFVYPSGGIDTLIFRPLNKNICKKILKISENTYVIGYISRIEKNKGWETFINAINLIKNEEKINFKVLILGRGSEENKLFNLIKKYNLSNDILYFPTTNRKNLPIFYNACDVFVFPTLKESLGLVGLEALACKVPIIGSEIESLGEYLINNFNGYFFKPNDYMDLKIKIMKYLLLDDNIKSQMSDNALKIASYFEMNLVTKKLIDKIIQIKN